MYGFVFSTACLSGRLNCFMCSFLDNPFQSLTFDLWQCFRLPMSLSNMNNWWFSPKKDYAANRLLAGILQLTDGKLDRDQ